MSVWIAMILVTSGSYSNLSTMHIETKTAADCDLLVKNTKKHFTFQSWSVSGFCQQVRK